VARVEGGTGRVAGKIAFITGAARGQGRSHAVRLAEEGADIIAVDLCEDIGTNEYPLATEADLAETAKLVEALDRRIVARKADVRDRGELASALADGIAELGGLDVVVANAGICPLGDHVPVAGFVDAFDVDFIGVVNAVNVALPHLKAGASIIATGSVAALLTSSGLSPAGPGFAGYLLAKQQMTTYMRALATQLAPASIRANVVHPTNVNTGMLQSAPMYRTFRPDLENPTREDAELAFPVMQVMPIPYVEPVDISHAVVYLASDESRYVTGVALPIDAGALLKGGPALG
jgi:SDR family mycofactocin-dependent oxidoreductase